MVRIKKKKNKFTSLIFSDIFRFKRIDLKNIQICRKRKENKKKLQLRRCLCRIVFICFKKFVVGFYLYLISKLELAGAKYVKY